MQEVVVENKARWCMRVVLLFFPCQGIRVCISFSETAFVICIARFFRVSPLDWSKRYKGVVFQITSSLMMWIIIDPVLDCLVVPCIVHRSNLKRHNLPGFYQISSKAF